MLGLLLRLAFFAVALVGLVLLFIFGAVVAVVFIPVMLTILVLLRKNGVIKWTTVDLRTAPRSPQGRPTVIDHDPNDVTLERKD
jgi:hypothetical protein